MSIDYDERYVMGALKLNPGGLVSDVDRICFLFSDVINQFNNKSIGSFMNVTQCKDALNEAKLLDNILIVMDTKKDEFIMPPGYFDALKIKCIDGLKLFRKIQELQVNNINLKSRGGLKTVIDLEAKNKARKKEFYDSKLFESIIYLKYDIKYDL